MQLVDYDGVDSITIKSCDNVLFRVDRRDLDAAGGALSRLEWPTTPEDCAELAESSKALEALFQFIYFERHPKVGQLPFDILVQVAEAAEKYQIYSAIDACELRFG